MHVALDSLNITFNMNLIPYANSWWSFSLNTLNNVTCWTHMALSLTEPWCVTSCRVLKLFKFIEE
jgi:hypothetical protein